MRRQLMTRGPLQIPSYVAMLYLGLVAGTYATYAAGRAHGLSGDAFAAAILVLLVPAVLGTRLAFLAGQREERGFELRSLVPRAREGGAVAYEALLSVPVSAPLLLALGLPFAAFWDAGAFGFLAAIVCLRIGCFLNGCCGGRHTHSRLGLEVPDARGVVTKRVPTQLLEAGWATVLLVAAALVVRSSPFPGALFLSSLGAYAIGRFFIEFARDEPRRLDPFTVAQAWSAAFVALSASFLGLGVWVG